MPVGWLERHLRLTLLPLDAGYRLGSRNLLYRARPLTHAIPRTGRHIG